MSLRPRRIVAQSAFARRVIGLGLVLALPLLAGSASQPRPLAEEYSVKAAFLFNFAKFVEWPDAAFRDHPTTTHFCIFGSDPFGPSLQRTLEGKVISARRAVALHPTSLADLTQCQLLFLAASETSRLSEVADATAGQPVLLVGEAPGFNRQGGMINFVLDSGFVRFEVSPHNAGAVGLRISSRLLQLARPAEGAAR